MQRVVHSVTNLIEQTQGTLPSFCAPNYKVHPHTTFPHFEQHYSANLNKTPQTTSTRGHITPGWSKHMHLNSSWTHVDNQIIFLPGARHQGPGCLRHNVSNVHLELKVIPRIQRVSISSSSCPPRERSP